MESTSFDIRAFTYIVTLAAVVNGLGIVRWVTTFSEYLRRKQGLSISHDWTFNLQACYQFLLHIIMWWMLWGLRASENFNFLTYLFLLSGPVLLFLSSSLLSPSTEFENSDIRQHYLDVRSLYATVLTMFWTWAIAVGPILRGALAPTLPLLGSFLLAAVVLRFSTNARVHGAIAIVNWILSLLFISLFAMKLGGNIV